MRLDTILKDFIINLTSNLYTMPKVFKKAGINQEQANMQINKALIIAEKTFGIHRSEFLFNRNPANRPAFKAKCWFIWACLDLYDVPTVNVQETGYLSYERIIHVTNVIRESRDKNDIATAKKMRQYYNEIEELCELDADYVRSVS